MRADGIAQTVGGHSGSNPFIDLSSARQKLQRKHAGQRDANEAGWDPNAKLIANQEAVPVPKAGERLGVNFEACPHVESWKFCPPIALGIAPTCLPMPQP